MGCTRCGASVIKTELSHGLIKVEKYLSLAVCPLRVNRIQKLGGHSPEAKVEQESSLKQGEKVGDLFSLHIGQYESPIRAPVHVPYFLVIAFSIPMAALGSNLAKALALLFLPRPLHGLGRYLRPRIFDTTSTSRL